MKLTRLHAGTLPAGAIEIPQLRGHLHCFRDRVHAGEILADLIRGIVSDDSIVLAIPSGGVPVAAAIGAHLGLPIDVAVVSKITLPWSTEVGYGAVAFDGHVRLNHHLVRHLSLDRRTIEEGMAVTRERVARRVALFRDDRPPLALAGRPAILVDDGLASGFTMLVAAETVRNAGAGRLIVAVPTGHIEAIRRVASETDAAIACANVRGGHGFAVADAYEYWHDLSEREAADILARPLLPH